MARDFRSNPFTGSRCNETPRRPSALASILLNSARILLLFSPPLPFFALLLTIGRRSQCCAAYLRARLTPTPLKTLSNEFPSLSRSLPLSLFVPLKISVSPSTMAAMYGEQTRIQRQSETTSVRGEQKQFNERKSAGKRTNAPALC